MPELKLDEFAFHIFRGKWKFNDLEWARGADSYRNFKPADDYSHSTNFEYGKGLQISSTVFHEIIMCETILRELVQRLEKIENKIKELQVLQYPTKEDLSQLEIHEKKLALAKEIVIKSRFDLWVQEGHLPEKPLKRVYQQIRENPGWYLREELIKDCKSRGGCCGRSCRCCEKRASTSKPDYGIGHCSLSCWCCDKDRGSEIKCEDVAKMELANFSSLADTNLARLLALTEAYFAKPGRQGLGRLSKMRSVAWYWRNSTPWQWKRISRSLK